MSQPIESGKNQAIDVAEGYWFGRSTPQHMELMSQDENFDSQRRSGPEQSDHGAPDQPEEIAHRCDYRRFAANRQPFWVCDRVTATAVVAFSP
jgi:hypothetical protein